MNIMPVSPNMQKFRCGNSSVKTNVYANNIPFRGAENAQSQLKVNGPSPFNGFDGSIKGDFNGISVDFMIGQKFWTFLDKEKLTGTYKIDDKMNKCDLSFNQRFSLAHEYKINGTFGDKQVDIEFDNPLIKYSSISGSYNSKDMNIQIDRKLSNIIRDESHLKGQINGKEVDLDYKGLFFFGGSVKGTFDGVPIELSTNQKINLFFDERDINIATNLDKDDKEDLLFLVSAMTVNDLYLEK